ncbi:FkbM family methyltransferase [Larkinella sp. GY13]|uniref:FkbM family methyltransferase n=1 Tax=Larkinella sp. GY13 TaxID=3453720 RepID=UPI003EEC5CBB
MKTLLRKIVQKYGFDIKRIPIDSIEKQHLKLLNKYEINLVFDIGANVGQFVQKLRKNGYRGRVVSFEPLPDAFQELKRKADRDPGWTAVHMAVGDTIGETQINVAKNSYSSSILEMLPSHLDSAPQSTYSHKINVTLQTVDAFIEQYLIQNSQLYVKIDTQGYEKKVFDGCLKSLNKISGFQMELSLIHLYQGETLMHEMVEILREHGFKLMMLDNGHHHHETGELLQVDGFFFRA